MDKWDFLDELPSLGDFTTSFEYAREISDILLEEYPGEVTADMQWSALHFGNLCYMIAEDGYNVITPEELKDAQRYSQSGPKSGVSHISEIETWIFRAGFRKIDTEYCDSEKYRQYSSVYCAPIVPSIDSIIDELDNPPIFSFESAKKILSKYSSGDQGDEDGGDSKGVRRIREEEIDAYIGLIRSDLVDAGWHQWESLDADYEIWIQSAGFDKILASTGSSLSDKEVDRQIVETILNYVPALRSESEIDADDAIDFLKSHLRTKHGWGRLWEENEGNPTVTWYSPASTFEEDLTDAEDRFKTRISEVDDWEDHDIEFLKERRRFLENNLRGLISVIGYRRDRVEEEVSKLKGQIDFKNQIVSLDAAIPASQSDEPQYGIESTSSREDDKKRSFWEFQQDLEKMEEENEKL